VTHAPQTSRTAPRWLIYAGLWLLLTCIFGSQLYFAGYVTPWTRAFASEAIYWLAWWILVPLVFWWCRTVKDLSWSVRAPALALGSLIGLFLVPFLSQALQNVEYQLLPCAGCEPPLVPMSAESFRQAIRVAAVDLPIYAGFVLAWHAAIFYREARDRQIQAIELESLLHLAQLDALRSQLNPHFLFNSLHSMAELVHTDAKLAERLIVRLGELLRQALQGSTRHEVTLAEELDFIRGYVDIEQMRLGERLRVSWDIEPAVLEARVPSLVLQPLVENAIQHGIAAASAGGTLVIGARREGGFVRLEVHDDGPGLSRAEGERPQGIGLANTRARLERLYGARQSFEVQAADGFTVRLRLPFSIA